ncbi:unnamed protein product [Protopolystoma xenopodis]|uniref:IFT140 first beta-propeller domain-containing protein n=1 Tax=Protopolystoma xenopodis TaxID=117903 RepID=A0A448XN84_9PLAT|nr:unnamed protein product [Protopolystoma xenopodis]
MWFYYASHFNESFSRLMMLPHAANLSSQGHDGKLFEKQNFLPNLDARRIRKAIFRRTIDYNAPMLNYLTDRVWMKTCYDRPHVQPDYAYGHKLYPLSECIDSPMSCVMSKPVRTSMNKIKCPIYCVCWTPEGRRLITGAYSGEFTLWNGLTFNFETILQAHESQIRCMKWSHNEEWLLTADHSGFIKYWQANMNNVEVYQAHKEPIRGVRSCDDSK